VPGKLPIRTNNESEKQNEKEVLILILFLLLPEIREGYQVDGSFFEPYKTDKDILEGTFPQEQIRVFNHEVKISYMFFLPHIFI
jgi:hypothetical protein